MAQLSWELINNKLKPNYRQFRDTLFLKKISYSDFEKINFDFIITFFTLILLGSFITRSQFQFIQLSQWQIYWYDQQERGLQLKPRYLVKHNHCALKWFKSLILNISSIVSSQTSLTYNLVLKDFYFKLWGKYFESTEIWWIKLRLTKWMFPKRWVIENLRFCL